MDEQVVRLEQIRDLADRFVRVRLTRITGVDLRLFEFDYDQTWAVFFLGPDERVLGRYGSRDPRGAEDRLSLAGLRYALQAALAAHQAGGGEPPPRDGTPVRAEDLPAARGLRKGQCIHCHQVYEFQRAKRQAERTWNRAELWVYPLPENVGITLDIRQGDRVQAVAANSSAARAGLRAGDRLTSLNGIAVASIADAQQGLHRAPATGSIPVTWRRDDQDLQARIELTAGWRWTNITWRPSMLDLLPSLPIVGEDLTPAEKRKLDLPPRWLAIRQGKPTTDLRAAGLREGDIVLGFVGQSLEASFEEFLAHVRRNHLVGERVQLAIVRDGKPLSIPLTLR